MRKYVVAISIALLSQAEGFGAGCKYPGNPQQGLSLRQGYVDYITPSVLQPFKDALPKVSDPKIQAILSSPDTMWYDESSMVFFYQDSIESVVGGRANCVARMVGEQNAGNTIGKLMNFFGSDYRFLFPFRTVAGTDNVQNLKSLNFWAPPVVSGSVLPVKYWRPSSRGRWYWTHPVGTVIGEVLYEQAPNSKWYVFEIRVRKRYRDGWSVDVFKPFVRAEDMAQAIMVKRPEWQMNIELRRFVNFLQNKDTLVKNRWESKPYGKVFTPIDGALDPLPEHGDDNLIIELLTDTTFRSSEGMIWKENASLQTYAPASQAHFSIVPKGYEMGMIPVNEVSCNRCHSETGHRLLDFEFDIQLYGEVWGEDRIFTWHLFEPNQYIYGTFDDSDVPSRKVNPRLVQAGLVKNEKPSEGDPDYKALPSAFKPEKKRKSGGHSR